jgi:outer membrane receptor protein involved in Fe transport
MYNSYARARRDGVRTLLAAALATVSSIALAPPVLAQTGSDAVDTTRAEAVFDIPAQPLSSALLRFAEQSDLQILFAQDDVTNFNSRQVRGRYAPEAALAQLLPPGAPRIEIVGDQIVRVGPARPQYASDDDDLVVTGTRIRGAAPAGSNVLSLDRGAIEETGRSTVQDVLSTLPQNFPGAQGEATQLGASDSRRNVSFGSTVDLRGLGADATLTLLNGRRLAPAGFGNFVDVSAIPVSAIKRIEILADGASAIYGADAVAGVVNVILRDDFEGSETALRYGGATQGGPEDIGVSHLIGNAWSSGSIVAGYEYRHRSDLPAAERWFSSNSDLRAWGGANFSGTSSNPGNITRVGANAVVLAIPENQDGTSLSEADLLVGVRNNQNTTDGNSLLPEQESHSVFGAARQHFGALTLSAEILASERNAFSYRFQNNVNLTVPGTNYYRQLNALFPGQGNLVIAYNMGADLGPTWLDTQARALNAALGAEYELNSDWRIEALVGYARHEDDSTHGNVYDSGALNAALASSDIATAFNPFADGSNSAPAVLQGLTYSTLIGSVSDITTFGFKADGSLWRLWGGDLRAAFGVERRREQFEIAIIYRRPSGDEFDNGIAPGDRTTDAIFAELFAPLLSETNNVPLVHDLTLSVSLRHEAPSDFEATTVPKLGLRWALSNDLALRATWGESFKAPQFQQMLGGVGGTILNLPPALDPFATSGSTGALILSGANAFLEPEEAETWTFGIDLTPQWLPGLELRATYFDVDFTNRIGSGGNILAALANPIGYETILIRNPTADQITTYSGYADAVGGIVPPDGIELIWDGRLTNLANLRTRGVDLNASYRWETSLGAFSVFASSSVLFEYERQANTATPAIDALDTIFNPIDWRARAGMNWRNEDWSALVAMNYADDYRDTISVPNRDIDAQYLWDAQVTRFWRREGDAGLRFTFNVQNLFDDDPPFANNPIGYGFDTQNASPIGRFISIELRQTW